MVQVKSSFFNFGGARNRRQSESHRQSLVFRKSGFLCYSRVSKQKTLFFVSLRLAESFRFSTFQLREFFSVRDQSGCDSNKEKGSKMEISCQEKVDDASRGSPVRVSLQLAATVMGRIV